MNVEYVNHMGDDLMVVNAARVSFSKESELVGTYLEDGTIGKELKSADKKLLTYLATHGHWTPFSHPQICVRVKAPIFVARQLFKHKVGMTENEVSRRYVDDTPSFYTPDTWRGRPTNGAKQGSSDDTVERIVFYGIVEKWEADINDVVALHNQTSLQLYEAMIGGGVAPEQARMVLPQSMYTEWYWTGSLSAFARICNLRLDSHAQAETREIAERIRQIITPLFPESFKALVPGE